MATQKPEPQVTNYQLPPWETRPSNAQKPYKSSPSPPSLSEKWHTLKSACSNTMNRAFPPHRRYLGYSRRVFLIAFSTVLIILIALILGLSIGLTVNNRNTYKDLPLASQSFTGDLTYYSPALGACGITSSSNNDVVSISHFTFDAVSKGSDPNANVLRGHRVRAVREGRSVDLRVVDRCVGCKPTDIDVSPGAFRKLADMDLGRVQVTWAWLPPVPTMPP